MPLTVAIRRRVHMPAGQAVIADVTFDTSYDATGEPLSAAELGFAMRIDFCLAAPAGGLIFEYDHSTGRLRAFYPTGGVTASPGTLSDPRVTSGASTASAVNATTPDITPGRGKEVATGSNLSSITCRVFAIGDSVGLDR